MAKNVAVGLLRPPHVFFYEIDLAYKSNSKSLEQIRRSFFEQDAKKHFESFAIYRTKHGFHLMAYPYSQKVWNWYKKNYPSDFTKKLRPRWNKKEPQVLRISEKWDLKTGKVVSPKPKFICGNFFLEGIMDYKVLYYAK